MSGSGRKRSSKWDLRNDTPFEDLNVANYSWPGKGGRSFHQREPRHGWQSPDLAGNDGSRLYAVETNDIRSKHDSGFPSRENISVSRGSHKSENDDKDTNRYDMDSSWDRGGSYDSRMSPGLEELRQQNRSHSPRAGWSRPLRGRSRSRSWSRSKSPVLGFRWDSGFVDRSRSRSGVLPQLCRDFVSGRCRRGDQCHFLHKGIQTSEDNWHGRHRKGGSANYSTSYDTRDYPSRNVRPTTYCTDFVKGKCRRGASCRFGHHGAADGFVNDFSREEENERRKRDSSIDHEPRRNNNIPCKFFAAGNCRNGRYCRFSHNNPESISPDKKSQDERRDPGQKSNYSNQVLGGPKWSDPVTLPNTTKLIENKNENIGASEPGSTAWSKNNNGFKNTLDSENKTCIEPAVSREAAICNDGESLGWKVDNAGAGMVPSESTHNEKWLGDVNMSPDWNFSIKSSKCIMKEENSRNTLDPESLSLNNASLTTCEESITHGAVALSHDDKTAVEKTVLSANLNISPNIMSNESFDQTDHQSGAFLPYVNAIGQNPAVIPTELQRGFLKIPEIKILPPGGKPVNGQDVQEVRTSIVSTGIPPTQKIVTSEQLNQLTNFSSSLAQLLGNGQLYSALIPNDLRGTSLAKSEVSIQPNPVTTESQKHCDPMSDGVESKKPENSDNPQSVLQNAIVQTHVSVGKSVTEPKDLMASVFPGGPRFADHHRSGNLTEKCSRDSLIEQKARCEVGREIERGIEENNKAQEESVKLDENGPLEYKEGPDDGKKGKDAKVIHFFKFALAEFVKELLKPTWKEGQINKDAYKTIVKKVVDKVTCTLQGANIPHTQEKIDHYLSSSKPKLMKLVQAYVGNAQQKG